jgi:hypothetical protein
LEQEGGAVERVEEQQQQREGLGVEAGWKRLLLLPYHLKEEREEGQGSWMDVACQLSK